jgi:hypothetical protein
MKETVGGWRKFYEWDEEFQNTHSSSTIIRVIKSRTRYVACVGRSWNVYRASADIPGEKDYLEDIVLDGRILLKRILKN